MNTWKRGDINPETNKIYSHTRADGKIQWYSLETWEKRKLKQKEFIKTEKSKQYQKEWYKLNKNKKKENSKKNTEIKKEKAPLKLLLNSIKNGAKRRNLEFKIDLEFLLDCWEKQNGKCYYTKIDMKYIAFKKDPFQVSIDRIDSSKGYTKDNVVLCCQSINYMKNDYYIDDFHTFLNSLYHALNLLPDVNI